MKAAQPNPEVLKHPIEDMAVSDQFKAVAKGNNFATLQDIIDSDVNAFPELPGSNYRMLKEFLEMMDKNGLMHLVN